MNPLTKPASRSIGHLVAFALALILTACQSNRLNYEAWKNFVPFQSPEVAGIVLERLPETSRRMEEYRGKHPRELKVVYWDGRVQIYEFEPDGTLARTTWGKPPLDKDSKVWQDVDYTYGSDPERKLHQKAKSE